MEHTPALETSRLILRAFTPRDAGALLSILGDREVNTFLPMFPLKSVEEAGDYLRTHASDGLRYAICLKPEDTPITPDQVKALVLTCKYDGGSLTLVTGTAFTTFLPDKTVDVLWDKAVRTFLSKKEIGFEEL